MVPSPASFQFNTCMTAWVVTSNGMSGGMASWLSARAKVLPKVGPLVCTIRTLQPRNGKVPSGKLLLARSVG